MRNIPTDIYIENGAVKNHGGEIKSGHWICDI